MAIIFPLSETALTVSFGIELNFIHYQKVMALDKALKSNPFEGFIETVPAYASLTVYYEPCQVPSKNRSPFWQIRQYIEEMLVALPELPENQADMVEIPVCYDLEMGYDLEKLAQNKGVSVSDLISWHTERTYQVYMLGFLPAFAYMGEVDQRLASPRKSVPRKEVAAGSVGIAGNQTGIYPLSSPAGWQILGRTPLRMLDWDRETPFLLKAGDQVRFLPISKQEFEKIAIERKPKINVEKNSKNEDILILKQGVWASLQDFGRFGYRAFGLPVSGAMDWRSMFAANALVGNPLKKAVIECAMGGLSLEFQKNAQIALTGGGKAQINEKNINFYEKIAVQKGEKLDISFAPNGLRTYLAVEGGFKSPKIMNSQSVYAKAKIGEILKKNMFLGIDNCKSDRRSDANFTSDLRSDFVNKENKIRIFPSSELQELCPESIKKLFEQPFRISQDADRMGYRLVGEKLLKFQEKSLLSSAVTKGTIQQTPDGQLIILMNDGQTIGGYPKIGQVVFVDLPILAQCKANDVIFFESVAFEYAESLYLSEMQMWNDLDRAGF